jgi:putative aldouronate transport system permease protein
LPVQNLLRTIIIEATASLQDSDLSHIDDATQMPTAQAIKSAAIVVSTLPILVVYPFIQKYFVKGVMVGSLKG